MKRLFKKRTWSRSFQENYEFDLVVCLSPFDESGQRNVVTPLAGVRFLPIKCSWTEHYSSSLLMVERMKLVFILARSPLRGHISVLSP